MHTFYINSFHLNIVSSKCFQHPIFHPQEDLYMQFYGISIRLPYQESGRLQDVHILQST